MVNLRKTSKAAVEPYMFDAELIDDDPGDSPGSGRAPEQVVTPPVGDMVAGEPRLPVRRVGSAVATAGRVTARAGYVAGQGGASWWRRAWSAATHGTYRGQIRLAEATGDRETLAAWVDRLEKAKDARVARVLALPRAVAAALLTVVVTLAVLLLIAVAVGVLVALTPAAWIGRAGGIWSPPRWTPSGSS